MNALGRWTHRRDREEQGATAVEYGLMVAFIAIVIVGAVTLFGQQVNSLFTQFPPNLWP